jgi:hypothetical protein
MPELRRDDVVRRIHRIVREKYPACNDSVHFAAVNVQLEITQGGKRWNFALGPPNALAQMDDEALKKHISEMKRIAPVTYIH